MSLIQDALKRKEGEETGGNPADKNPAGIPPVAEGVKLTMAQPVDNRIDAAPASRDAPDQSMPVSPGLVAAPRPAGPRKASYLWFIVAAIAIGIGMVIVAGIIMLARRLPPGKPAVAHQSVQVAITGTTAGVIAPAGIVNLKSAISNDAASTQSRSMQSPGATGVISMAATAVTAAAAQPGTNPAKPQLTGGGEIEDAFVKPAAKKKFQAAPPASKWPALKLTGILRGVGTSESTALLNGRMIRAGQVIEGVALVEIQADGVVLKYGSENKFLRIGATSY